MPVDLSKQACPASSLLRRHLDQPSFLFRPPLYRFRELVQHLQRRHRNPSLLAFTQRLTKQILILNVVTLIRISTTVARRTLDA